MIWKKFLISCLKLLKIKQSKKKFTWDEKNINPFHEATQIKQREKNVYINRIKFLEATQNKQRGKKLHKWIKYKSLPWSYSN